MADCEETENFMHKALGVTEIPENFDPNKIPETGEEYIHYVMFETKNCQEYLKAEISADKLKDSAYFIEEPSRTASAPEEFLPSLQWQQQQVSDFSAFRLHLQKIKLTKDVPPSPFNGGVTQWKKKCLEQPKLTELLSLNQKSLFNILNFYLIWLSEIETGQTIDYNLGCWLYAILSCLETPLMPEYCYTIREIARKCSEIRQNLQKDCKEDMYKPLNLIICLIARYYNNHDLADDINEI